MIVRAHPTDFETGPTRLARAGLCAGVPEAMRIIIERLEVGRSFSFGEAVLSLKVPSVCLEGSALTLLAVWGGSLVIGRLGERRKSLDAAHCGLFLYDGDIHLEHDGAAPATIAWCRMPIDIAPELIVTRSTATPQIHVGERIRTLLKLGLDIRSTTAATCNESYRNAIGVAAVNAFSADVVEWSPLPLIVRKAREYVDAHFSEECDLSLLADVAGVTREHLTTAFRKHIGLTPVRYLWSVRVKSAVLLVQSSDLNLSAIAERCGYKTPYHLSREIKRVTGVSPREIRRRDSLA